MGAYVCAESFYFYFWEIVLGCKHGRQTRRPKNTKHTMKPTSSTIELAWSTLAAKNRLLSAAVKNQDFGIIPSRKSEAMRAYNAFWALAGADEFAASRFNSSKK